GFVGGPNALIPNVKKDRFNVNVVIENNDVLFHLKSDSLGNLANVVAWVAGSNNLNGDNVASPNFTGLFHFHPPPLQFPPPRPAPQGAHRRVQQHHQQAVRVPPPRQPRLVDDDGLRRPADRRQRGATHRHLRRLQRHQLHNRQDRRLLRQRLLRALLARHRGP